MGVRPVPAQFGISQHYGSNPTGRLAWNHPTILRFGNYQPNGHTGIDFAVPVGTPVFAPDDGVVTWADWGTKLPGDNSQNGWALRYFLDKNASGIPVCIEHTAQGGYVSISSHLNATSLNPGDRVVKGQLIGTVAKGKVADSGNTGLSTGPHLHFEVVPTTYRWDNGMYGRVDPTPYIRESLERAVAPSPAKPSLPSSKLKTYYPLTSKAFTTPANCSAVFGYARPARPVSDVIHHWDDPVRKPTFEGTETYLRNQPSNGVSAHWIGEAWRVSAMVDEKNASHANGHSAANAMTVTHEWNPRCSADDREALAQHISNRWIARGYTQPGIIELHRDYFATACPGFYANHIGTIRARAGQLFAEKRAGIGGASRPGSAPAKAKPKGAPARAVALKGVPAYRHVAGQKVEHVVRKGDTLYAVSRHFGASIPTLRKWNKIDSNNTIHPGQRLRVR